MINTVTNTLASVLVSAAPYRDTVSPANWANAPLRVQVLEQSPYGALADVRIAGASFAEGGILFNGSALRNPQTEHFNGDITVPSAWFGRSAVFMGADLFRESSGHNAGSMAVRLDPRTPSGGSVVGGVGLHGLVFGRADALERFGVGDGEVFAGAFADAARADRIDGYDGNEMERASAGGRFGAAAESWTFDSVATFGWRDFGCRGSYGTAENYPAWEEDAYSLLSGLWTYTAENGDVSEISASWMRFDDSYRLYRDNPDFYQNDHRSDAVTLRGKTRLSFGEHFFTDLRAEGDAEIYTTRHHTNYSGFDSRTKRENFRRFHGSFAALPGVKVGDWTFAAGAAGEFWTDYDHDCAPAAEIAWQIDEETRIVAAYREGFRQPNFTELTYDSPDTVGTRDLPLSRARTASIDCEWRDPECEDNFKRLGFFYRRSSRVVDWLKAAPSGKWTATSVDSIDVWSFDGECSCKIVDGLVGSISGFLTLKDSSASYYASRYALDWPLAGVRAALKYEICEEVSAVAAAGLEKWKSNPVRREDELRAITSVAVEYAPNWAEGWALTVGLDDLLDQRFDVYPGQKALGISGYLALAYRW